MTVSQGSQRILLEISTPLGKALEVEVDSVQVPGSEGEFGVLPGHLPLLSALKPGVLRYYKDGNVRAAAIDAGYAEAGPGRVSVLTEGYAPPERVDVEAVTLELAEAEKRQAEFAELHEGPAYDQLLRALRWAEARLEAGRKG
jgi:F-type H+-transporting ATPase subunit epsilon